jgi:hypothetical protein
MPSVLVINLTEEVKGLYSSNCKAQKKEIGDDVRRWKDTYMFMDWQN